MEKQFIHELVEPFRYSDGGNFKQAETILVNAPRTGDNFSNIQFLDSLCNRAEQRSMKNLAGIMKELGDDNNDAEARKRAEEQEDKFTDDEKALIQYNQLMSGLERAEINQLNICIAEILKDCALVDGTKKFEAVFFNNEMSLDDIRLMIGKYIVNFTSTSRNSLKKG